MSELELTAEVHRAIVAVAAEQLGLITVESIEAVRGWGGILFVRVHARQRGAPDPDVQEAMHHRFRTAVHAVMDGDRSDVNVTWASA